MAISRSQMTTQLTGDRMPAKSEKQRRYMAMAYNDPDMGVPKEVAKKFMKRPAQGYKAGGKLPDLTGDGKVTQADVLKGRGVFKAGGKVGYHKMPDGTMMKDSEHKMKKGGTVKKYQAGGAMKSSPRPRMRPDVMEDMPRRRGGAPMTSPRPRARPDDLMQRREEAGAVERGNRAAMREAYDQETLANGMKKGGKVMKMKAGGKVRGCGMARGGAVRQCKMVKMKGS